MNALTPLSGAGGLLPAAAQNLENDVFVKLSMWLLQREQIKFEEEDGNPPPERMLRALARLEANLDSHEAETAIEIVALVTFSLIRAEDRNEPGTSDNLAQLGKLASIIQTARGVVCHG